MGNPRSHRRYKDVARAYIASLPGPVPCVLCGTLVDVGLPGSHPLGPTIEHNPPVRVLIAAARTYAEAVALVADTRNWAGVAHRRCQSRQGQAVTAARNRARNATRRMAGASRDW
jgi:hypothetical protein